MQKFENYFLWLIAISGLSFWFFIGFPFANYYESYYWIGELNRSSFFQMIFQPIGHYSTYRPLGQLVVMILYKVSNGSMFLIELSNYLLTISAILIFILSTTGKRIFSLVMLVIGGILFAGFGHLFHLHGLYYSVVLIFLSLLFYYYKKSSFQSHLIVTSVAAVIAGLFHPLALIFHLFYLIGNTIESGKNLIKKDFFFVSCIIILEIILLLILSPGQGLNTNPENLSGLMGILKTFEANKMVTVFLLFLALLPILSLNASKLNKIILSAGLILLAVICYLSSLPIMIVVVFASAIKLIYLKRWTFLSLLIVTFFFTIFTDVQSGHLKFFVLFVLTYTIALDWKSLENKLVIINIKVSYAVTLIAVILVFLLRNDTKVPVLSKLSNSVLAKKESTYQLEKIIDWYLNSAYQNHQLVLFDNSPALRQITCAESSDLNPTTNENLRLYLNSLKDRENIVEGNSNKLYIFFSKCSPENSKLVHSIKGKYSRNVSVYLMDK